MPILVFVSEEHFSLVTSHQQQNLSLFIFLTVCYKAWQLQVSKLSSVVGLFG